MCPLLHANSLHKYLHQHQATTKDQNSTTNSTILPRYRLSLITMPLHSTTPQHFHRRPKLPTNNNRHTLPKRQPSLHSHRTSIILPSPSRMPTKPRPQTITQPTPTKALPPRPSSRLHRRRPQPHLQATSTRPKFNHMHHNLSHNHTNTNHNHLPTLQPEHRQDRLVIGTMRTIKLSGHFQIRQRQHAAFGRQFIHKGSSGNPRCF